MQFNYLKLWITAFICIALTACGYGFVGGGKPPGGIESICIDTLQNRTNEVGAENTFTSDLINEFITRSNLIVTDKESADAFMEGAIVAIRTDTISRKSALNSVERRIFMTVDLKLTSKTGKILWYAKGITEKEEYQSPEDQAAIDDNKRTAIRSLSQKLAERVYNRLTDNF